MNNEWERYQAYNSFPENLPVSGIRLAKAGFYYCGIGTDSICFHCGFKCKTAESIFHIHQRLSPNCPFADSSNIPINTEGESNNDASKEQTYGTGSEMEVENTMQASTPHEGAANGRTEEESKSALCISGKSMDYRNLIPAHRAASQSGGHMEIFPGITHEKAKHPDYSVKSVRLSSFSGWTSENIQPQELAEAGFFYRGNKDRVHCFFCGEGLSDWQQGDNAWIEHARWHPNCAFVEQSKGIDFINMCRTSNIEFLTNAETSQNEVPAHWNMEGNGQVVDDQTIEDINSQAAKLVLDMGYIQTDVEAAIKFAREKYGNVELRAQNILEFLLDNNYTSHAATGNGCNYEVRHLEKGQNKTSNQGSDNFKGGASDVREKQGEKNRGEKGDEHQSLLEENQQLKDRMTCKICMDKDACIVFLPCGHMVSCVECAHALRKCAICRTIIQGTIRAYPA